MRLSRALESTRSELAQEDNSLAGAFGSAHERIDDSPAASLVGFCLRHGPWLRRVWYASVWTLNPRCFRALGLSFRDRSMSERLRSEKFIMATMSPVRRSWRPLAHLGVVLFIAICATCAPSDDGSEIDSRPPNIVFIVLDDTGVDLLRAFGYGGELTPPADTVSIDAIAQGGVRFRNTWSMPTCSPTRTSIFSGQYPSRTGVTNAITSTVLAQSQASPYTVTTPKLLRENGYVSALVGKMHLSGSDINPANHPMGDAALRELGWDYFAGYHDGGPYPVDTTAGGVASEGTHRCGFVPTSAVDPEHGADEGVCYLADGEHEDMAVPTFRTPGRTCLERGGIFDPNGAPYSEERRAELNFGVANGYYAGGVWITLGAERWGTKTPERRTS